ncbi:IS200/IS605 family accessory protein TnpB-related protein [Streptomyces sp. AM6-12]|uniref:IS200/IS605 family accessory protein TnpB-related protein n=1 Tax=Streptomyces sp. AM6-12 TaxID=3345149 RepID=UPI0037B9E1E8
MGEVRKLAAPFVVPGPTAVTIRTRLRVSTGDASVLTEVGTFLGSVASGDIAGRSRQGLDHDGASWAARKRALTQVASARWAGSITRTTHDQWALARRGQADQRAWLRGQIAQIEARLARPLGAKADKRAGLVRGYATRTEWHAKSRRLRVLRDRSAALEADWHAGRVRVVRGGKRLALLRHHLAAEGMSPREWAARWQAARMFLSADGESGKRCGNETIRVTGSGEVSLRLPAALAHLANAPHGRYVLDAAVAFTHRADEWQDRIAANRAVAYRIHHDPVRGRWYVTASWQRVAAPVLPLRAALVRGVVGVDMNDDHLAAWSLDTQGNPVGEPRRFRYDLSGTASHRDAQIRHALTRLLHHTRRCGAMAIAVEDLHFRESTSREQGGVGKRFRHLISRFPTARLRARLVSMAAEQNVAIVAVDPAYTSRWGAQHWQRPLTTATRETTRHDAAAVAIGRRALGYAIRRRPAPPPYDRRDRAGHRTVQAGPSPRGREGPRPRLPGPRTGSVPPGGVAKAGDQRAPDRCGHAAERGVQWHESAPPLGPRGFCPRPEHGLQHGPEGRVGCRPVPGA